MATSTFIVPPRANVNVAERWTTSETVMLAGTDTETSVLGELNVFVPTASGLALWLSQLSSSAVS